MNNQITSIIVKKSLRGQSNSLRKGKKKIHRRYIPKINCKIPLGTAAKIVEIMSYHNWHRNSELIMLRRKGYTPYTKRNDPKFSPKPMRISTRSESCETLTVLSLVLSANCDYYINNNYLFEITQPFEKIAMYMGMLHKYKNGRKAYDAPLHALSVMEQLSYVIILRGKDTDSGQNKPLRIWLTEKFFTSRGIKQETIYKWLSKFHLWAMKKGLTENLKKKYERHLLRIEEIGIDLKNKKSLCNRLKKIKKWVISPDLKKDKENTINIIKEAIKYTKKNKKYQSYTKIREQVNNDNIINKNYNNFYYHKFIKWSTSYEILPIHVIQLENNLKLDMPGLQHSDIETYYKTLLERAGAI